MKANIKLNLSCGYFAAGLVFGAALAYGLYYVHSMDKVRSELICNDSKFGNWLAAQHAIFGNDFSKAHHFLRDLKSEKSATVTATRNMVAFLDGGEIAEYVGSRVAVRIVSAAMLARESKWKDLYSEFKNEKSAYLAPFRVWSGVGVGNSAAVLKFIDGFSQASASWRNFTRAAVYAATKNPKTARKYFSKVSPSFMNLGDYHLVMSFYKKYGFKKDADSLRKSWISSPGGMYMANLELGEDWSKYDNFQKMLAAALIQNVSHSGEDGLSDTGLLSLRVAALLGGAEESVDYYLGGYFYASGSNNYKKYWVRLVDNPIYGPFIEMKMAEVCEKDGCDKTRDIERSLRKNPLFMPAIIKVVNTDVRAGREMQALRVLNRALKVENLPDAGRAYLLKLRGHTLYVFGDFDAAEQDLQNASNLVPMDAEIMSLLAQVWTMQKKNLDQAYHYAISLIRMFPGHIGNWNTLAMVVNEKDGWQPALEILEKVGSVAEECSELFVKLGDLRIKSGNKAGAADAYRKAISLSDDGLVIKSEVEQKLKQVR